MSETTTIRIKKSARKELNRIAKERQETLSDTVTHAIRLLKQENIGKDLATPLRDDELSWLNAADE